MIKIKIVTLFVVHSLKPMWCLVALEFLYVTVADNQWTIVCASVTLECVKKLVYLTQRLAEIYGLSVRTEQ